MHSYSRLLFNNQSEQTDAQNKIHNIIMGKGNNTKRIAYTTLLLVFYVMVYSCNPAIREVDI